VHHLAGPGGADAAADLALRRLGASVTDAVQYLVRPDGYIGYRAGGSDLAGLHAYLRRWLPEP
jgi:hypothetical protein